MNERERAPLERKANQGIEAMTEQLKRHKEGRSSKSRLYPEVSNELKAKALDTAIAQQQEFLSKVDKCGRIDLNDLEAVKKACSDYLESCRRSGVLPSMTALSPSMGFSRQAVYAFIRNGNTDSARYLDTVRSAIAAVVEQAGLNRSASEPLAIFILKNSVDMADKVDISASAAPIDNGNIELTAEEIARRYGVEIGEDHIDADSIDIGSEPYAD